MADGTNENKAPELQQLIAAAIAGKTEEELVQFFYDTGRKTALTVNAFLQGFADVFAAIPSTGPVEAVDGEAADKAEQIKTDIGDCRACWCDTCGKIDSCGNSLPEMMDAVEDGIRPRPCMGCMNGMRFQPKEKEPCDGYVPCEGFNNG